MGQCKSLHLCPSLTCVSPSVVVTQDSVWAWSHLLGQVEGSDAKRPEAAEHGEDTEAQVISGRHQQEGVLTL